jgi:hypothetical protein
MKKYEKPSGGGNFPLQLNIFEISILLLTVIPIFLAMLLQLINTFTSTGRKRILSFLGFLIAFFLFLSAIIFAYSLHFQPLLWFTLYGPIFWILNGVSPFILVYYVIILAFPDFFNNRKWALILPVIGFIGYLAVALNNLFLNGPAPVYWSPIHYYGFLLYIIVYMLIIPLFAAYQYLQLDRIRGTPRVKWILVITLGTILWFTSYALMLYPPFSFTPALWTPVAIVGLAWWVILIGSVFDSKAAPQRKD